MAELNARIIAKASATAAEEPLAADLEVAELAVNTADGKLFTKHTDGSVVTISGGGGGGAVDSVNSQTGVVSLGIQDMDDVDVITTPTYRHNSIPENVAGGWNFSGTGYWQINAIDADGKAVNVNDWPGTSGTIWISTNGDTPLQVPYFNLYSSGIFVQFQYDSGTYVFTKAGECLTYLTDPASTSLVEGDILQWNDADQAFQPAQLLDVPVDSVNGETGVVSLGIQDMDDFLLNQDATTATWAGEWEVFTLANDQCMPAGGAGPNTEGPGINLASVDSNGVNQLTNITSVSGKTFYFSINDGPQVTETMSTSSTACSPLTVVLNCPAANALIVAASVGDVLKVSDGPLGVGYLPLAEGDILQWNDADQKFNPAQLPDTIDKATLKTEVAASTDFADFQSRIAAL